MFVCVHIHIHTNPCTHVHTHAHTHMHACIHIHMYKHSYPCLHTLECGTVVSYSRCLNNAFYFLCTYTVLVDLILSVVSH